MRATMYACIGQVNKQCLKAVSIHSLHSISFAVAAASAAVAGGSSGDYWHRRHHQVELSELDPAARVIALT